MFRKGHRCQQQDGRHRRQGWLAPAHATRLSVLDELPPGLTPKLAPVATGLGEIFYYSVNYKPDAKNMPATEQEQLLELSEIQEYTIKPLLRTVPGIAEINGTGGYERQFVVQPKPEALERIGMTFSELAAIIAENVENAGGGIISRGGEQLTIRAVSRVNTVEDLGNLPIKFGAAIKPMLVKDVADRPVSAELRDDTARRIADIRAAVRIPVVANGEIWTVQDALRCREASGCDMLMLGRGMVTDPGLAWAIHASKDGTERRPPVGWQTLLPLIADFWQLVCARLERRQQAGRLKQWLNFLRRRYPEAELAYMTLRTINDARLIDQWLAAQLDQ